LIVILYTEAAQKAQHPTHFEERSALAALHMFNPTSPA
jgi:hypothetical protein